jgi:hypothetical protein
MKTKFDKSMNERLQEREEDIENLISAAEVMAEEKAKMMSKVDETKNLYN